MGHSAVRTWVTSLCSQQLLACVSWCDMRDIKSCYLIFPGSKVRGCCPLAQHMPSFAALQPQQGMKWRRIPLSWQQRSHLVLRLIQRWPCSHRTAHCWSQVAQTVSSRYASNFVVIVHGSACPEQSIKRMLLPVHLPQLQAVGLGPSTCVHSCSTIP